LKTLPSKEQSRRKKKILLESKISAKDLVKELEKRLCESTDSAGFSRDKDIIKAKIQILQERTKMFSEIDVPKIKETNQDFLDNSSANMKVIVDREKI
jgi:hypothetical protein